MYFIRYNNFWTLLFRQKYSLIIWTRQLYINGESSNQLIHGATFKQWHPVTIIIFINYHTAIIGGFKNPILICLELISKVFYLVFWVQLLRSGNIPTGSLNNFMVSKGQLIRKLSNFWAAYRSLIIFCWFDSLYHILSN